MAMAMASIAMLQNQNIIYGGFLWFPNIGVPEKSSKSLDSTNPTYVDAMARFWRSPTARNPRL